MLEKPQLLIVGNDDGVMDLIFEQLREALGPCVLEFTSALSIARNSLAGATFDGILLDLSVANHGAENAIAMIRTVAPETPLLLLLDRRCGSGEMEFDGVRPEGFVFKDELRQGFWVEQHIQRWVYGDALPRRN